MFDGFTGENDVKGAVGIRQRFGFDVMHHGLDARRAGLRNKPLGNIHAVNFVCLEERRQHGTGGATHVQYFFPFLEPGHHLPDFPNPRSVGLVNV